MRSTLTYSSGPLTPLSKLVADTRSGFASGARDDAGTIQVRMNNVDITGMLDLTQATRVPASRQQIEDFALRPGDVLFNNTNSTDLVGKTAVFSGHNEPVVFSNHFTRVRVTPGLLEPRYLARWLTSLQRQKVFTGLCTRWVNQSAVRVDKLLRLEIPLPPLPEQKRIADILDKADAIRRKRQEALLSIDEIIQAAFMQTVGPDAEGFDDWPSEEIQSLAASHKGAMRTGPFGSTLKHSEFVDSGIAVLGIDNAVKNWFAWDERRYITEEKYEGLQQYTVYPGDVLITIMGTNGRSAVVPDDIPLAINTKHLACITLDRQKAEPEFVSHAIHRHPVVLHQLGTSGRGAIMTGLNLGIIKKIKIPKPPLEVQKQFCRYLRRTRDLEGQLERATTEMDNLFNSLVQRAFKGEL